MSLRVAAISFLNPAPLLYNFEHEPTASTLRARYTIHYTSPANCAAQLHTGKADLGLIPIAELTPDLAVVPGCTIASLRHVHSILLLVEQRNGFSISTTLSSLQHIAADTASRSSTAYLRTLLDRFYAVQPAIHLFPADPLAMLQAHGAALLIGDPALFAREHQDDIEAAHRQRTGHGLFWIDLAELWHKHTGLPWVAAVWAVHPASLTVNALPRTQLIADLNASRIAGKMHVEDLVTEWSQKLPLSPDTIRTYLTQNIYYDLDANCLQAIETFRTLAAEAGVLPPLPALDILQ